MSEIILNLSREDQLLILYIVLSVVYVVGMSWLFITYYDPKSNSASKSSQNI